MPSTYGLASPNSITHNLDVVMSLAFANTGNEIFDEVSKNLAIFHEIKKNGMYTGVETPDPYLEIALMYGLGRAEWYEGWDVLGTQPTEGITGASYPWRQLACPVGYNYKESRITHPAKVKELVRAKIDQAKITMSESWVTAFLQGNVNSPGGSITSNLVSTTTGRSGIEPLPALVYYDSSISGFGNPSGAFTVGGLDQATYPWWRNWSYDAGGITTYAGLLGLFDLMYTRVGRGAGGNCNLILVDDTTRSLINTAYYDKFRRNMESNNDYPFDNLKFHGALIISDESVPDVENGVGNTDTKGTAYFLNTKFMQVKYDTQRNFILDDFQKPINQDGKVAHCMWMGNSMISNRKKQGVIGNIPRTLT